MEISGIDELVIRIQEQALELEDLKVEWQTSECLLAGSQRDNEEKHSTIERMKVYIKSLENLLSSACGPNWREDHSIEPLHQGTTTCSASTPLPKPTLSTPLPRASLLRHSVSISSATRGRRASLKATSAKGTRRASYASQQTRAETSMLVAVVELDDADEKDDTPTAGIRLLKDQAAAGRRGEQVLSSSHLADGSGNAAAAAPALEAGGIVSGPDIAKGEKRGGHASGAPSISVVSEASASHVALMKYLEEAENRLEGQLSMLDRSLEQASRISLAARGDLGLTRTG